MQTGASPLTTDFAYDGDGFRVKKTAGNRFTLYAGDYFEKSEAGAAKFLFANNSRIAKIDNSGAYYFHQDHLGSTTVVSNATGNAVAGESAEYKPFGGFRAGLDSMVSNYRFTDQEFDPESNLYYYDARYYDPIIGRFVSADTVIPDYTDPQSLNRYSYVKNNPLMYTDPDGHLPVLALGLGFLFNMAYDYYDQWQESKMPLSQYHSSGSYTVQRAAYEGGWGAISAGTGSAIASTSLKIGAKALTSGAIETGYEYAKKKYRQ